MRIKDLVRCSRSFIVGSLGDEFKDIRKKFVRKWFMMKDNLENLKENICCKRGFFGFGRSKMRRKSVGELDYYFEKENKL